MLKIRGHEIEPHFSALAVAELEEVLGLSLAELIVRLRTGKAGVRDMLYVIWAGALDSWPGVTVEAISEAAQETLLLRMFRPAAAALIQGTNTLFPGEDEEGSAEPGKN